jgi:hypothetical protein
MITSHLPFLVLRVLVLIKIKNNKNIRDTRVLDRFRSCEDNVFWCIMIH